MFTAAAAEFDPATAVPDSTCCSMGNAYTEVLAERPGRC